ncbi:peptidylprolyl isomerase [Thalassotalea nanhaiensis]|uniref:Peptidylprolyl isomerase n=1 Tax=Thalassotalea nanhaiensis TaxID=3065648 RepID=A0ABY9TQF3_9GAMM|nr:peptidylprolyl isomerase [Colwelliaceae bacterium SQ345]
MFIKIITEPLIHFLLLSIIIFVIYDANNTPVSDSYQVTVSEGRVQQIKNDIVNSKQRLPVGKELDIAIKSFALNEIYLREARELGLNKGDKIINRRLRQKMEYLLDEMASLQEPSSEELNQFYDNNIDRYHLPNSYSFTQVYVSTDRTKDELVKHINMQKLLIEQGKEPQADASMLPAEINNKTSLQVERELGKILALKLEQLPLNQWAGPISSNIGQHFIYLHSRSVKKTKPFELVKEEVLSDWQYEQRDKFKQAYESELMQRYIVDVKMPNVNEAG